MTVTEIRAGASAPAQRVMLAVPCYDWKVHAAFMQSAIGTAWELARRGVSLGVVDFCGCCDVDTAQNVLLRMFLESNFTDILIMGSDQGWEPGDIARQCLHDRDIVGSCPPKKQEAEGYPVLIASDEIWSDADGLVEVLATGSGGLRMRRHVVEALAAASDQYAETHVEGTFARVFERKIIDGKLWSGDNVVCLKARDLGFRIFVDPAVRYTHSGQKVWKGSLADYWSRLGERAA